MPLHHPCMSVLANSGYPDLPMQLRLLFVPVVASEPGLLTPSNHGGRTVRRFAPFAAPYELLRGDHSTSFAGVKLLVLPTLYSASAALSLSQSPVPGLQSLHPEWFTVAYRAILGSHCSDAYAWDAYPECAVDQFAQLFPACDGGIAVVAAYLPLHEDEQLSAKIISTSAIGSPLLAKDDLASSGILPRLGGEIAIRLEQCSGLRALSIHDSLEAACTELIALRLAAIGRDDSRLATHVGDDRAHLVAESSVGALDLVYLPPVSNPPLSDWDARVSAWVDMARQLLPDHRLGTIRAKQLPSLAMLDEAHPREAAATGLLRHPPTRH